MLLPITLIGISSTDSTGQMCIIHNHLHANMHGRERKICHKETIDHFSSFLARQAAREKISLVLPYSPAHYRFIFRSDLG